ncbi:flavin-containing monooxygenase [Microbacterium saperdae]|uniref:Cation diffusion facilitator CzcD-associated flavoprotein CzcO n=1 Tax=Microbacterium saperdae TaxID=69368 RepID=A0A543BL71_9MICO|nr:NAD(P)/FAD-dependent oxidoreductase [Microbacterium saperdae]TQL85590.1 cation diffusion facilitator CzcD-associated flavoprotein CzcO [Microbacterium saperdae]GGM62451.1 monooxygenase [Microbacterium saperdae]
MTVVDVDVLVVGAGFSGIAAAMMLKQTGLSFQILERASTLGGTWRDNVYPGVACDVPSHLYSLATHPDPRWSRLFAPGAEIREYLERVASAEGIDARMRFDSPVRRASWTGSQWLVEVGGTNPRTLSSQSIVLACGRLTEPQFPRIPGLGGFPGPTMHTARWSPDTELRNRRVALVGTGASAVQLLPELVAEGATVTLFQRTPPWVLPKGDRAITPEERERMSSVPGALEEVRKQLFDEGEARYASRSGERQATKAAREAARSHLRSQVADPGLRESLMPRYPFGCKRVLLSDDFYPALASPAVTLEPSALAAIRGEELVAASGSIHRADLLVFATGFETIHQPYADIVEGEDGYTLAEHWSSGMASVGSTLVARFPDLYILNGPNAALGHNSSLLMIEEQCRLIERCVRDRRRPVRVSTHAQASYTEGIIRRSRGTPWVSGGCTNWYVDERNGRLSLLWPGTVGDFREEIDRIFPIGADGRVLAEAEAAR